MLELTGVASILRGISLLYWMLAVAALVLVVWKVKRWPYKVAGMAIVVALFGYVPLTQWIEHSKREAFAREAWAHFAKRCKENSGEKIVRTVKAVDGILLFNPRPKPTNEKLRDQHWMGDPYGYDHGVNPNDSLIQSYLWDLDERGGSVTIETPKKGYRFVEVQEDSPGRMYLRHTLDRKTQKLVEAKSPNRASAYGVRWEDVSTPEDRKHWVAGGKFQIVDLNSNEVIAERIGYLIEPQFGSKGHGSGRLGWVAARLTEGAACPPIPRNVSIDRIFVQKVLQPAEENSHGK